MLGKLEEAAGGIISPDDIEVCHRVPVGKNHSDKNIVVQSVQRTKRSSVLGKARRVKLTANEFGVKAHAPILLSGTEQGTETTDSKRKKKKNQG